MGPKESRVLVVSTDLEILRALTAALTWNGYTVRVTPDWAEVPERLHGLPRAVLLYDLKELDGPEWRRLADLRRAHPALPVVLLASLESPELDRALAAGLIAGYLLKPFRLPALEACLERIEVEGQRARA